MMNDNVRFFVSLAKVQTVLSRNFDSVLNGLSFHEFIVLYYLKQSEHQRMRRIDLAEKLGVTPSGMTRMLLPMEKIGLVDKDVNPTDARSTLVVLASGGAEKLLEAMDRAELYCKDLLHHVTDQEVYTALKVLHALEGGMQA